MLWKAAEEDTQVQKQVNKKERKGKYGGQCVDDDLSVAESTTYELSLCFLCREEF